MALDGSKQARGKRVADERERRGLTLLQFADQLNEAAQRVGLATVWNGPRIAKIEQGGQNLAIEDVAVLEELEPAHSWFWWSFGVEKQRERQELKTKGTLPASALTRNRRRPPGAKDEEGRKRA